MAFLLTVRSPYPRQSNGFDEGVECMRTVMPPQVFDPDASPGASHGEPAVQERGRVGLSCSQQVLSRDARCNFN